MDAFLSDKESWYYMKLLTFTLGIGMEVLHQYFEQKILRSMDFYVFVEKYKHYLFHECFPTVQCCECSQMPLAVKFKTGYLNEIQFKLLFDITPVSKSDHYKIGRNNTIVKDCLCRIDAKRSNEVDCMDITLMCAIIKACLLNNNTSIHGNPRSLETIKETRNFLAHSTDLRIPKSEFDTRWDITEHAVIEIASVVGNYFAKLQQRKIDAFKNNELSMENIKTIIDNNADEVKKNLQTLVEDQRKNTMLIKDEIIENLTKYKDYLDELSIDIGSLKFEVKQYALAVVASCSAEETFDSQVHQKDAAITSYDVSVTGKDKGNRRCRVEWRLETPSTWNLPEIKDTLEKFSALLRQWFEIEFVYVGSLVIKTLVQKNVLDNQEQMRKSIHSFLEKIVDVCKIKTDVSTVIKVALIIDPGESDYKEEAEEQTSKIEMNKKDKTTCIFCNKSFDCQNCLQKAKIISSLEDELSENRKESSAISLESVVSEMDKDSPEIKSLQSVSENIGDDTGAKKAQVATGHVLSSPAANYARLIIAVKHTTQNMLKNVLEKFIPLNDFGLRMIPQHWMQRLNPADLKKIRIANNKGYSDFDIPLIYNILQIFQLCVPPTRGWDPPTDPLKHEISIGDDIERCRRLYNVIVHRPNAIISSEEFNDFLSDFKSIARRFEIYLNKQPNEFVSQFEDLELQRFK
ncbi:Hypothetical predicted protein [Mytilus galloprovincialis]|uniref:DZIP3-like HEPN domain-containing protein n=1 Tax=Mytilus galloprovincialis TaxID=29158 RepID=A0A8B6BK16_MYTGA|nr:Hypothetical predicted protein [Mytilus galloprovincialis]